MLYVRSCQKGDKQNTLLITCHVESYATDGPVCFKRLHKTLFHSISVTALYIPGPTN